MTTNLADLALVMKPEVKARSTHRLTSGFLLASRSITSVFASARAGFFSDVVVYDRMGWYFGLAPVNVLMIGIAHKGVGLQISWTLLSNGGGSEVSEHLDLVDRFLKVAGLEQSCAFVPDRRFTGGRLYLEEVVSR